MFLSLIDVVSNMIAAFEGASIFRFLLCLLLKSATRVGVANSRDKCLGHMLHSTRSLGVDVVAEQAFV